MTVFALLSAGGSPGVTTTALALTLGWPSQVILAECDPSGGDVLAGLLAGHLPASTGLLPLALEAGAGTEIPVETLRRQLVELDEEHDRLLLAGISDPRQSAALQSSLPWIADALQAAQADVIADCGRLDTVGAVRPVLSAASLAVLVLRPTLRQASRAVSRVEMLASLVGRDRVVLLLVGEGTSAGREIAGTLGVPVAGQLPEDSKTAAVLSDGSGGRHRMPSRPLIRAAMTAGRGLRDAAAAAGPLPGYADQAVFSLYTPASADPELGGSGQPGLRQLGYGQPGYGPPGLAPPGTHRPGLAPPVFGPPGTRETGIHQRDAGQPGTGQRHAGLPSTSQRDADQPGSGRLGSGESGRGRRGLLPPESLVGHIRPGEPEPGASPSASDRGTSDRGTSDRGSGDRGSTRAFGIGHPAAPVNGHHYGGASSGSPQNGSRP